MPRAKSSAKKTGPRPPNGKPDAAQRFRNRIVELRNVPAGELRRNPKNWRVHDDQQRAALEGILSEIGFAGALAAYVEDGELVLFDGHLRADLADTDSVPVLVTDLTREEVDKVLASFDVIGGMAGIDVVALSGLAQAVVFDSHDLTAALDELIAGAAPEAGSDQIRERAIRDASTIMEMELQPLEHYDYVLVLARNRSDWHRVCAVFGLSKVQHPQYSRKVGLGRCVEARRVLEIIDQAKDA
jgi:hypothetical protein